MAESPVLNVCKLLCGCNKDCHFPPSPHVLEPSLDLLDLLFGAHFGQEDEAVDARGRGGHPLLPLANVNDARSQA